MIDRGGARKRSGRSQAEEEAEVEPSEEAWRAVDSLAAEADPLAQ